MAEVPAGHPVRHGRHHRARRADHRQRPCSPGWCWRCCAASRIRPLNWLIIFVVDLFRSLPPLVIIVLIYFGLPAAGLSPSGFVSTWLSLAFVLMAFSEEIFWAGITSIAEGAVGGLALDRPVVRPDPDQRRAAAGPAAHHPAAHQPHHRHHQGHRARHRRGRHRDPGAGELGGVELLQSLAADDGRGGLPRAVPAGRRRRRAGSRPSSRGSDDRDLLQPRDHRRDLADRAGGPAATPCCCR